MHRCIRACKAADSFQNLTALLKMLLQNVSGGMLFFGASVTAQSHGNGYYEYLATALRDRGRFVERKAFGSCHLDDAGFYAIHEIDFSLYQFCFLDWNTTGLSEFSPDKLCYVMRSMLERLCIPVIMILPQDRNLLADRSAERQMIELAQSARIPLIDLRDGFVSHDLLRDHVHTTPEGAKYYAERLLNYIEKVLTWNINNAEEMLRAVKDALPSTEFRFFKDDTTRIVEEGQRLMIQYAGAMSATEILFDMIIGPFSPVVEIEINGQQFRSISIWDPWCHYERNFQRIVVPRRTLATTPKWGVVSVNVLKTAPEYDHCRVKDFSFEGVRRLHLNRVLATNLDFSITIN